MKSANKTSQVQIRVSPKEKAAIMRQARKANMGVSEWLLRLALPSHQGQFQDLVRQLKTGREPKYVLAELHDLLNDAGSIEFNETVRLPPPVSLSPYLLNYVAAMVEYAAVQKGCRPPVWARDIPPLEQPVFGTDFENLKLHLLTHAPPPFRRRNIFIDSTVGARV